MSANDELINCARNGQLKKVEKCLKNGANINASDENGETALTQACDSGHYDIVKYLIEQGADTNADGGKGLMFASYRGYLNIVQILTQNGADIKATDGGWTALMFAAERGHFDIVKFLTENGADANARNDVGCGALEFSATDEIWEYLKPKVSNIDKNLALINFAMRNNLKQVEWLLAQGADINATDSTGWTALMFAARDGHFEVVEFLIAKGANVNATTHKGNINALYLAQTKEIAQILQNAGAKSAEMTK